MNWYKIAKFGDVIRQNYINQNIDANIIDNYLSQFNVIRKRRDKEMYAKIPNVNVPANRRHDISAYTDFHDLERVVDYVKGQKQVIQPQQESTSEIPPIYQDNNVSVYRANNAQEAIAIKGNFPASWCIAAASAHNMYNTYRYNRNEPTFYFVKDHKADPSSKYAFFVVQVDSSGNYIATSARNDGDIKMNWDKLVETCPSLKNLQSLFKNVPLTDKEKDSYEKFRAGLNDNQFAQLPYEDKKLYLDTVGMQALSAGMFRSLPDDLKNHYLSFGIGLDYYKFKEIKDNPQLLKRYKQMTERKIEGAADINALDIGEVGWMISDLIPLSASELAVLDPEKRKQLISKLYTEQIINIIDSPDVTSYDINIPEEIAIYNNRLSGQSITNLVRYSHDPIHMVQTLGKKIDAIGSAGATQLLELPYTKEDMQKMVDALGLRNIKKVHDMDMYNLIKKFYESNEMQIIEPLTQILLKNLSNNINNSYGFALLTFLPNKDEVAKTIANNGRSLTSLDVVLLLRRSINKVDVAQTMGQKNINKLLETDVYDLLSNYGKNTNMAEALKNHPFFPAAQRLKSLQYKEEPTTAFNLKKYKTASSDPELAYWITPSGKTVPIPYKENHAKYVLANPSEFNLTPEEASNIVKKYETYRLVAKAIDNGGIHVSVWAGFNSTPSAMDFISVGTKSLSHALGFKSQIDAIAKKHRMLSPWSIDKNDRSPSKKIRINDQSYKFDLPSTQDTET